MPARVPEPQTRSANTSRKVQQGQATLTRLLAIARDAFSEKGYAATTTQEIIDRAGVTKGALYHHFPSKLDLFEAVYLSLEAQIAQAIAAASSTAESPWDQLVAGCNAYLAAFQNQSWHRILRIDGPAALGYQRWAQIDQEHGLERLSPFLEHLAASGVIKVPSVPAFARLLTGAMNEATFWIAEAKDPDAALAASQATLLELLQGVRAASPGAH